MAFSPGAMPISFPRPTRTAGAIWAVTFTSGSSSRAPDLGGVVLHHDGPGRADCGALAAAHAGGLGDGHLKGCGDGHLRAPVGKVDGAHILYLVAHTHAVPAENALVLVPDDADRGLVQLGLGCGVGKAYAVNTEAHGQILELAGAVVAAGGAVPAVVGEEQLQNHLAVLAQPLGVGADVHPALGGVEQAASMPRGVSTMHMRHAP